MYTILYTKQITNKDPLCHTGNSTQYSVITYKGKNLKIICVTESFWCIPETKEHCESIIFQFKKDITVALCVYHNKA